MIIPLFSIDGSFDFVLEIDFVLADFFAVFFLVFTFLTIFLATFFPVINVEKSCLGIKYFAKLFFKKII